MALPFALESLVMKPLDVTKAFWAGDSDDILPFFISFQNLHRYPR